MYLAGFLITLSTNWPFASNSFFRPKTISKVAIIKTKSATIAFFSSPPFTSPRSFFFSFPFPSLLWFCSFSGWGNMLACERKTFFSFITAEGRRRWASRNVCRSQARNMPFDAFSLKWPQISLGWCSKNCLDIYFFLQKGDFRNFFTGYKNIRLH